MRRLASAFRPAWRSPNVLARLDEPVVDVHRLLGGDVQLVAELAEVGDADAQHAREADVDLARGAERERLVRQVGASSPPAAARATAGLAR